MRKFILFLMILACFCSCDSNDNNSEKIVLIKTDLGDIKVKLYNETPLHRDNFIKLVKSGFYNDLLFHRVINNFMIQGGDPDSKNYEPGVLLGEGSNGGAIDAEFVFPEYFHKKGVLAAARESDDVNPDKKSSDCQFYLVTGKVFCENQLEEIERNRNNTFINSIVNDLYSQNKEKSEEVENTQDMNILQSYIDSLQKEAIKIYSTDYKPFKFTDEQKEVYNTIGGTPWLDDNYTIFGEIIEGLDVIDKIQNVSTDKNNRPVDDIKMKMKLVKK